MFQDDNSCLPFSSNITYRAVIREATAGFKRNGFGKNPEKELLDFFREENIGVECNPRCGNCQCGKCALGTKKMSLKDEREYNNFARRMRYDKEGTENDPGPYWRCSYPWKIPKEELIDNYPAVIKVMDSTAKKLKKDPSWRAIYENTLKDLVGRGFAREVSNEEILNYKSKGGKTYYIAHQMAINPGSKSTPVRAVFNSSQVYKGFSLNSSWALGPEDIMANLNGMLMRFREDLVGAQGDITKMYYMVRIEPEEEMMQLFVWITG